MLCKTLDGIASNNQLQSYAIPDMSLPLKEGLVSSHVYIVGCGFLPHFSMQLLNRTQPFVIIVPVDKLKKDFSPVCPL